MQVAAMEKKKRKLSMQAAEMFDVNWQEFWRQRELAEGPCDTMVVAGEKKAPENTTSVTSTKPHGVTKAGVIKEGEKATVKKAGGRFKEYHWHQWEQEDAEAAKVEQVDNDEWEDWCREEELPCIDDDFILEPQQDVDSGSSPEDDDVPQMDGFQ